MNTSTMCGEHHHRDAFIDICYFVLQKGDESDSS